MRFLSTVAEGCYVVLRSVDGGEALVSRLASMGLIPGMSFEVHKNSKHGPVVLAVKGTRLMLGRGMADKVLVS